MLLMRRKAFRLVKQPARRKSIIRLSDVHPGDIVNFSRGRFQGEEVLVVGQPTLAGSMMIRTREKGWRKQLSANMRVRIV